MKFATGAIAALAVMLGLTAFAQLGPAPIRPGAGQGLPPFGPTQLPPPGGRGPGPDLLREAQQALKLSPSQVYRLFVLLETRSQSDLKAQENIQVKLDALAALHEGSSPRGAELDNAALALRQAEQAFQAVNDKFRADFLGLLTDEQKKTVEEINAAAVSVEALRRLGVLDNRGPVPPPPGQRGPGPGGPRGRGGRGGLAFVPAPETNPLTPEKVALGRQLFFDKGLSSDGAVACATCHDPALAFSDGRAIARGVHGKEGSRNSPALINAGLARSFFWDGRVLTLERQVLQPFLNPKELGLTEGELERRTGMKAAEVTAALASYVRTIRSTESRFDQYTAGQTAVLNDLEKAGLELFRGRGQCAGCHGGPNLTDDQFHNTGVAWNDGRITDEGRFAISRNERDRGAFKTPTLREIARTAPYMHDGSLATLEDVIEFYSEGGRRNPNLDPRMRPLRFSPGEKKALAVFLRTLSGHISDGL